MTATRKTRRLVAQTDDDHSCEAEATLAEHLVQTFKISCSFCGESAFSSAAVGQAADYNDRFDVAAPLVAKGWGAMTASRRSRKLRPACPMCLRKPRSRMLNPRRNELASAAQN